MARVFVLLMDSFGIGYAEDAEKFGDVGANTFYHIAEACALGTADIPQVRQGYLKLPNLTKLGLNAAAKLVTGCDAPGFLTDVVPEGLYGYAREISCGKDTPSGHWEIAGVPVLFAWGYFPAAYPSFPDELVAGLVTHAKLPGILGNCRASGTEIIKQLGEEHIQTGKPICYTSADSVLQIAAHEESFGLSRLYEVCKIAYELVKPYKIARVIARPFLGTTTEGFYRTDHRRDYSVAPPEPTLLAKLVASGGTTIAIGKIADIFAHQGISHHINAHGNDELFQATIDQVTLAPDNSLVFTNFVDFDMKFGHRRDVAKYALALERFDALLPKFTALLRPGDLAVITADHGCDPTFKGTDHTREYIPVLVFGPTIKGRNIGRRETFADIGQSLAQYLGLPPLKYGTSFL